MEMLLHGVLGMVMVATDKQSRVDVGVVVLYFISWVKLSFNNQFSQKCSGNGTLYPAYLNIMNLLSEKI